MKQYVLLIAALLSLLLLSPAPLPAQGGASLSAAEQADVAQKLQAAEKFQSENDLNEAARNLNAVANLYWEKKAYDQAVKYFSQSLQLNQQLGNSQAVKSLYNYLGMIYADKGQPSKSIEMYEKSLELVRRSGKRDANLVEGLKNLAYSYESLQDYPKAIQKLQEALEVAREMNNLKLMSTCYFNLADLSEKAGNSAEATTYFNEFNKLEKIMAREQAEKKSVEAQEMAQSKRQVEQRLQGTQQQLETADSLVTQSQLQIELLNREKELSDLKLKEQETALQNERLKNNFLVAIAVFVAVVALLLFYGLYRVRAANRKIKAQQQVIEVEKEKSDNLLRNILPESTAQELKDQGYAKPRHYDSVSVLFTDFVGFTQVASKLEPAALVKELEEFFLEFDEIIERHKLEKIKTIGDAYMCAGGLPEPSETHAIDTVRAALEIKAFVQGINQRQQAEGKTPWQIRIGIHTGSLVAGVIGKKKFAYDIWGDAVNTASRMESSGEANRVNISGDTHALIEGHFKCTYRGKVEAKNKGEVDMYFVEEE
jgi:adenylate cyclase